MYTVLNFTRKAALLIWKQRLGSTATYQKLIDIFEHAGYCSYAENVRKTARVVESETDDSTDSDEPVPQPPTYPCLKPSNPSLPPHSCDSSIHEEYILTTPSAAQDLPEGEDVILAIITLAS